MVKRGTLIHILVDHLSCRAIHLFASLRSQWIAQLHSAGATRWMAGGLFCQGQEASVGYMQDRSWQTAKVINREVPVNLNLSSRRLWHRHSEG